ncbi:MAG: hypothetical protein R3B48_24380 [Kofleriaceae bacterium]
MAELDPEYLRTVWNRVEREIESRWGVPVRISDVPNPFTGDLDGAEIQVDHDVDLEDALFILIHLFGHTVQWNVSAEARAIAVARPTEWTPEALAQVEEYERDACRLSLQLLHEVGVRDLDQWVSDFAACDLEYLLHFYKTGERGDFRSFWRDGTPVLTPLPIPEFAPTAWLTRWSGTVI